MAVKKEWKTDQELIRQMENEGFEPKQIALLKKLRESFPHSEFASSLMEWRRIQFLRFLYEAGILNEGR